MTPRPQVDEMKLRALRTVNKYVAESIEAAAKKPCPSNPPCGTCFYCVSLRIVNVRTMYDFLPRQESSAVVVSEASGSECGIDGSTNG